VSTPMPLSITATWIATHPERLLQTHAYQRWRGCERQGGHKDSRGVLRSQTLDGYISLGYPGSTPTFTRPTTSSSGTRGMKTESERAKMLMSAGSKDGSRTYRDKNLSQCSPLYHDLCWPDQTEKCYCQPPVPPQPPVSPIVRSRPACLSRPWQGGLDVPLLVGQSSEFHQIQAGQANCKDSNSFWPYLKAIL